MPVSPRLAMRMAPVLALLLGAALPLAAQTPTGIPIEFQVEGATVRAQLFADQGVGPHATIIELKGLQQLRGVVAPRAPAHGYHGVSLDFRGQNDSEGQYAPANTAADVAALIAVLRSDRARDEWGIDPARLIVFGTSAGSLAALTALADDPAVACGGAMVPFNWGLAGLMVRSDSAIRDQFAQVLASLDPERVRPAPDIVGRMAEQAESLDMRTVARRLRGKVVFLAGAARDAVAPVLMHFVPLVVAARSAGAAMVRDTIVDDGHDLTLAGSAVTDAFWHWVQHDCPVSRR